MTLMIDRPFSGLDPWVSYFHDVEIPVMRSTAAHIAEMRAHDADVDVRSLAKTVSQDPLMILRLFIAIAKLRAKRPGTEITSVEGAILMIGVSPFFRQFETLPIVESQLKAHPKALLALLKVVARARHAARWARDWAILRRDLEVEDLTLAALLHDFAEILMWCFAPTLASRVLERQSADSRLRSVTVQQEEYGAPLYRIKLALAQGWHLPQLLVALMDPEHATSARVRNVKLAVDLARHTAAGWDNAALDDDLSAIGELLRLNRETLLERIGAPDSIRGKVPSRVAG